jgi:pyruvate/2-oxoglutarate/acetoin dehydrogenase E1 component
VRLPATPEDAKGLLMRAIEDPNPVLFFEHKHLLPPHQGRGAGRALHDADRQGAHPPGGRRRQRHHVGRNGLHRDEAAKQLDGVSVEIVDLRSVLPWDKQAVLESVRKTSKCLVLHEDTHTGGFGAEIAATIAEEAFEDLDAPIRRITAPDSPVPFSPALEKAFIPQVDDVARGLKELAEY